MAVKRSARAARSRTPDVRAAAKKYFGFDKLRPGQEEAIRSLLARRDTLVVMPTGSGKSAIYQVAGAMRRGAMLVISPLIALQKDQVDSIAASEAGLEAMVLNSTLSASELESALEQVAAGQFKFVFLAPEQLAKEEVSESLAKAGVKMIVIDEAHCISQWGHDFRPDYLQLGRMIEALGHPVTLALTATASETVRAEIIERLGMRKPRVFVTSFDRPNIRLRVDRFEEEHRKLEAITHQIRWADKPGIVYVGTRKMAEEIMRGLGEEGIRALFYHGGMKAAEREEIQDRFMSGDADVIVATNAFGMGIDKPDIRFVYHYDAPDSLDSYYQEIGRAGRDGERAEAILFYRKEDIGAQAFHTGSGKVDEQQLEQVTNALANRRGKASLDEIAAETQLSPRRLQSIFHKLADAGAVEILASGEVKLVRRVDLEEAAESIAETDQDRQNANRERLERMREYAETSNCRRQLLLNYFGEEFEGPCGNCDNCEASDPEATVDPSLGTRREVVA
ncbi:MAG TPA: ATP-dependent DNA helicase RecQ [Bryobacteraceae bacterium]|jgi:ATP-dependent DNA helicase RecQ|nr:ATP-dependent DNA helicase RecQ [Bryobacteraceae bacterium]